MAESDHDGRLSEVERELTRQGTKLESIERNMEKLLSGVETLTKAQTAMTLAQASAQASAPQALSWKAVGATLVSVASAGAVIWGVISMSPAVNELREKLAILSAGVDKRLTEIDGKWGRLSTIEAEQLRTRDALGWRPTVARSN